MSNAARNKQALADMYAAFFAGDIDGWFAHLAPEAVLREVASLPYAGDHRGRPAIEAAFAKIAAVWDEFSFDVAEIIAEDETVIAYGMFSAIGRATGRRVRFPMAERWLFSDGKVIEVVPIYGDMAAAVKALGTASDVFS